MNGFQFAGRSIKVNRPTGGGGATAAGVVGAGGGGNQQQQQLLVLQTQMQALVLQIQQTNAQQQQMQVNLANISKLQTVGSAAVLPGMSLSSNSCIDISIIVVNSQTCQR